MAKKKQYAITIDNINDFTTADKEKIFAESELNRAGFPLVFPTRDKLGKRVVFSFVDAYICDKTGKRIDDETATFDVLDGEMYNKDAPDAKTRIKFIAALLSRRFYVKGGLYFRGFYYTSKVNGKRIDMLTKSFMQTFFHLEDGALIEEFFDKGKNGAHPYWPTKGYDGREVVFSAVDAYVCAQNEEEVPAEGAERINFEINWGDMFDLNNEEDKKKIAIIHDLLNAEKDVVGFYYKGKLIPRRISASFKLYLEKNFIKKNFAVEQRDFLMDYVTKDPATGYPLFYPMRDKTGRDVQISVLDAVVPGLEGAEKFRNFHVYGDEEFNLADPDFELKLEIIQALWRKAIKPQTQPDVQGALYFDGILMKGNNSLSECDRRRGKVEKALKIYISSNKDFARINKEYEVGDRVELLNRTPVYDKYFPDAKTLVPGKDKEMAKDPSFLLKGVSLNVVDPHGKWEFENDYSFELREGGKLEETPELLAILRALHSKKEKVRGALFFKGKEIARSRLLNQKQREEFFALVQSLLSEEGKKAIAEENPLELYTFSTSSRCKMPIYWPTKDSSGREVLCSVVDASIHFKNGRHTVRACERLNFDIYVGETFGLVGESGSGKTTISRAILGINKLVNGGIYFKGKLISDRRPRKEVKATKKNIQMIFQDPAASLNERANVDYIISEGLYNFHLFRDKEERLNKVNNMLRAVGLLPEHLSRYPHEFSGGQRQRIGIARALVIEPQLVLADEPISALDVSIRAQVLNLLKKLQKEQKLTYLFIAHDLSIIRYISDRIAVMHNGHIVELGPAEEIYTKPLHPYTRSLLTAIPQPDPKTKDQRIKIHYEQGDLDYDRCAWKEFLPGHFVLVNDRLEKEIKDQLQ